MKVAGKSGELLCGGLHVARLTDWDMDRSRHYCSLTATVEDANEFYLEHGERFAVLLDMGERQVEYRDVGIILTGKTITVRWGDGTQ